MEQKTQRLMTSPQIWIYFVTAAGATIATVLLYWAMAGFPQFGRKSENESDVARENHVPRSLQRGYTDIEKNPKFVELQGLGTMGKAMED